MEWISIKEDKPRDRVPVLVTIESYRKDCRWVDWMAKRWNAERNVWESYLSDGTASGWAFIDLGGTITHWMYLPEPAMKEFWEK